MHIIEVHMAVLSMLEKKKKLVELYADLVAISSQSRCHVAT